MIAADRGFPVGLVPIQHAELFANALRAFAPESSGISLEFDYRQGAVMLWVNPGFDADQLQQWSQVWWRLRESLEM